MKVFNTSEIEARIEQAAAAPSMYVRFCWTRDIARELRQDIFDARLNDGAPFTQEMAPLPRRGTELLELAGMLTLDMDERLTAAREALECFLVASSIQHDRGEG